MQLRKPSLTLKTTSFILAGILFAILAFTQLLHHYLEGQFRGINWVAVEVISLLIFILLLVIFELRVAREFQDKQNFHLMLQNVSQSLLIIDPQFHIIFGNRVFAEQAGLTEDKVVGRFCYEISHHNDRPCFELGEDCPVKRAFETGDVQSAVHVHTDAFGDKCSFQLRACPIKEFGKVVSVMEITSDITEQRRLERQLQFADRMEAVGKLAGGIAHDFNNILGVITGYCNLLTLNLKKIGSDCSESRSEVVQSLDYVRTAEEAAERAAKLAGELLTFSSRRPLDPKPLRISSVLSRMKKVLPRVIPEDISISIELPEDDLVVRGDISQIEQIVMNLAINARDSMLKGGNLSIVAGSIILNQAAVKEMGFGKPGAYATITIEDTGSGISPENLKKIFDPFFTTKEMGKGTGLGLAMVYGLVKQHDGYIDVRSEIGKGTAFVLYFPAVDIFVADEIKKEAMLLAVGIGTVLLVEDDDGMRDVTEKMLRAAGYQVITAKSGEEGLKEFRKNEKKIRLIMTDLVLCGMDGYEFSLRAKKIDPNVRFAFVSGYGNDVLLSKGIRKDDILLLPKPFSGSALLEFIKKAME